MKKICVSKKCFIKIISIFFSLFLIISCASKPVPIPGDTSSARNNIYVEYLSIADAYFDLENYTKALNYYKLAGQNRKLYWECYYKTAKIYVFQSEWDNASVCFSKLLSRDPDNASIKASLAYIYSMQGNTTEAIKLYSDLIEKQPSNFSFYENYIALLLLDEKIDLAEEYFNKLKENNPDNKSLEKLKTELDSLKSKTDSSNNEEESVED